MARLAAAFALLACLAAVAAGCGSGSGTASSGAATNAPPPAKPRESGGPRAGASSAKAPTARVSRARSVSGREAGASGTPSVGVCGRARGKVVDFLLLSDTPGPKCAIVGPGQRLRFVNATGFAGRPPNPVRLDWAGFEATIPPHHAVLLDAPIGSYLGSGIHDVATEGAPGPTVWVKP
jgi:hypothetical protein